LDLVCVQVNIDMHMYMAIEIVAADMLLT
jgi:hypothetical protein